MISLVRIEMARKGTRKAGLFTKIYSPLKHLIMASRDVGRSLFTRSSRIVDQGLGAADDVGSTVVRHANMTVQNITRRRGAKRGGRRRAASRRAANRR